MKVKNVVLSIIETLITNIVIYFAFFVVQANQDVYLQINPHPLLLLSIIMGLRYGHYLGTISALISTLFFIRVFLVIHGDIYLILTEFSYYKYPLLFFWLALILGYFKDNKDTIIKSLTNEKNLLIKEYTKLSKSYKLNEKIKMELKKQIIVSDESILNLYEIAKRLQTLDVEEVFTETIGVLSKYLKSDKISIYTYGEENGFLRLKIRVGENSGMKHSFHIEDSIGLKKVITEQNVVKWNEVAEEDFPLMVAPIIKDNKVFAIVNIEHMEFDRVSEYAFQLFKLITDWVNKSLERAVYVDQLKESKYIEGTSLFRDEAFIDRLNEEERRKSEFGMDFCLLKYRLTNGTPTTINEALNNILRSVDVVSYEPSEKIVSILLPATSGKNKYLVDDRIRNKLQGLVEAV